LTGLAVDMDDAGAALRGVAPDMGAGEPQALAQVLTSKVRASASAVTALPFTVIETLGIDPPPQKSGPKALVCAGSRLRGPCRGEIVAFFAGNR
jgi:hypothetical protein